MTPCEEKGYFPGMLFEHIRENLRGVVMLVEDDNSETPAFMLMVGERSDRKRGLWLRIKNVSPLFPAEEYPDLVWVEGIYDIPVQIPRELLHKLCLENHWLHESLSKSLFRITR